MHGLELREYQHDVVTKLRSSIVTNRRSILCAQTGAGKTRMAKWILGKAAERNPKGVYGFFVHRRGLVDNASDSFNESPSLEHGVMMSGRKIAGGHPVQVGSIDSLLAWYVEKDPATKVEVWQYDYTFDMVVYDEAHAHLSKLIRCANAHDVKRAAMGLKPCVYIGLSATPSCDGIGWFNDIVYGPPAKWLQEQGFAANYTYYGGAECKVSKLVSRGGEFTKESVAAAFDGLAGDMVRDWHRYADKSPTVGFFPRLSHARDAQAILLSNGIRAEYVDGATKDEERQRIFRALNDGSIDYICNVGVIERGTDIGVGCVQLCTAVKNLAKYLQMIGRGSRVNPLAPNCIVIDHGANIQREGFGFWEDERTWSLDQTKIKVADGDRASIKCPGCGAIYRGGRCSKCAYEPTPKELKSQDLMFVGGELKRFTKSDRKKPSTATPQDIMVSALFAAGRSGKTFGQAIGIAKRIAKQKGVEFRVPKHIDRRNGERCALPSYGSADTKRKVSEVFTWTAR